MNFHILTLFPEMVENGLKTSIIGRAVAGGLLSIEAVNIRDFAFNKHQSVDDYPYGGGAGMLMQAEPVYLAYKDIEERIQKRIQNAKMQNAETEEQDAEVKVQNAGIQDAETVSPDKKLRVVYLSPQGKTFDQKMAEELAEEEDLVLLCGHYEGIDERVLEEIVTDYVSIGDYVLTGGELPAMVMVDTISRLVPGVLHNDVSAEFESFQDNLLEYPQYSRPEEWHGKKVPPVLLSGHHANRRHRISDNIHSLSESCYEKNRRHTYEQKFHCPQNDPFCIFFIFSPAFTGRPFLSFFIFKSQFALSGILSLLSCRAPYVCIFTFLPKV